MRFQLLVPRKTLLTGYSSHVAPPSQNTVQHEHFWFRLGSPSIEPSRCQTSKSPHLQEVPSIFSTRLSAAHPFICWALSPSAIHPLLLPMLNKSKTCHTPTEKTVYWSVFSKVLLATSMTTWLISFFCPTPSKTKQHAPNKKHFPPLNRLTCRGTDQHSLGQKQGRNWSQGSSFGGATYTDHAGSTICSHRKQHQRQQPPPTTAKTTPNPEPQQPKPFRHPLVTRLSRLLE